MFENFIGFFKKIGKKDGQIASKTNKDEAKERLHLVLMQDRANVSADFLDMMKQEIIDVIKKYIDVDENDIDVRLTNKQNSDGTTGAPALYANIPIKSIKNEARNNVEENKEEKVKAENKNENEKKEEVKKENKDKKEDNNKLEEQNEVNEETKDNSKEEDKKENKENKEENKETPKVSNQKPKAKEKKLNKKK